MRSPRTFRRGGLSVELERGRAAIGPVSNAFLPSVAVVPLRQHAGPEATCLVRKGEYLREGALIGKAAGPGSAPIHASVPGVVREIRKTRLPDGGDTSEVVIFLSGSFERLGKRAERYLWTSMSKRDILNSLKERGVVEAEPPGRPLHELVHDRAPGCILVLDAVESEPYLRTEAAVLETRGFEVAEGLRLIARLVEPSRIIAALDADEPALAASFEAASAPADGAAAIEIETLLPRYPQDLPDLLLEALSRGRKQAGQPEALILRPSTALAAYEAVVLAKPFLERHVTVSGGAVKNPAVLKARIGTPIGDLIAECGGFLGEPERLVLGGPFRGTAVYDLDTPLSKTTRAVLALTKAEVRPARTRACVRCGRCAEVCPERLAPELLYRLVTRNRAAEARDYGLLSCTLCGACGYACPSRVPLVETFASRAGRAP